MTGERDWDADSRRSSATSARKPRPSSVGATSAACQLRSCGAIRVIRAAIFPIPRSRSLRHRSKNAASFSRSWCVRCAAPPTRSRSSPAGQPGRLIGQPNADQLAQDIVERGLNVRQVESLARDSRSRGGGGKPKRRSGKSADTVALEKTLSDALGLSVSIDDRDGKGTLHIHYSSLDQLDEVTQRLQADR